MEGIGGSKGVAPISLECRDVLVVLQTKCSVVQKTVLILGKKRSPLFLFFSALFFGVSSDDQSYGTIKGLDYNMLFSSLFLRWLGVTRASDHPVLRGHRRWCC